MNKTVLITGASRGIGAAAAKAFAKEGYNLILICKNNIDKLNETAKETRIYNTTVHTIQCDVSNPTDIENILKPYLISNNLMPDILVNNAGISHIGLLQDLSYEEWDNILDTNLKSMFMLSKLVIPSMVNKKYGRIINISSMWGNIGASCEVAYSASKGGVNTFTKALAKELAPSDISVNAIAFGVIDTEMNQFLSKEDREALAEEIPAGRFATATEAADMIVNIANAPIYMTGQIITMDGGMI